MRVIGPNTNMNVLEPWPQGLPGRPLGIITQSGYQGRPITQGQVLGIGIEAWATIGNEADVEWADFVDYFTHLTENHDDDGARRVGAIATYVEGFKSGRTMMLAADAAARARVPIVCVKIGRSDEGRKMAQAHTGHLTGVDAVHDAVFEQFGVIRVDDLDELIEISGMFCHTELVPGDGGVAVYAMSGGTASHVADLCGVAGVPVPKFAPATVDALSELVPWYLQKDNPLDSGGAMTRAAREPHRARAHARRPQRGDAVRTDHRRLPRHERRVGQGPDRAAPTGHQARHHVLELARSTTTRPTARCATPGCRSSTRSGTRSAACRRSAGTAGSSARTAARSTASPGARPRPRRTGARAPHLGVGRHPRRSASKQLLASYGIPTVAEHVATSPAEAVAAARALGLPVVMKILSGAIAAQVRSRPGRGRGRDRGAVRQTYRRLLGQAAAVAPAPRSPASSYNRWCRAR